MTYFERIRELTSLVPVTLLDFSVPRTQSNPPTQASSNFITNKEQGDWAENLIVRAINDTSTNFIAVKYGKSDDIVAGEHGFDDFYRDFQVELDEIGKRPDLLIFKKEDFNHELGLDISKFHHSAIHEYVKKAIAGIEVRSSAFLIDSYENYMSARTSQAISRAMGIKENILTNYSSLLSQQPTRAKYLELLNSLTVSTISVFDFRVPSWSSSLELIEVKELLKELKSQLKVIQKRDYLSITPKVEDIKVVYKWIETYNVPHMYFQVFFDKVYGISFENILKIISDSANEDIIFSVEKDSGNQNKTTIKIKSSIGAKIAYKVDEPDHKSVRREMDRGRLLFYIKFDGGTAYLDLDELKNILNIDGVTF